jgi:ADP-heptose:LPS heptosyltransferase
MKVIRLLKLGYLFFVSVITFIFDTCVITIIRKSAHPRDVAVVRLDGIGDFILWLDAAKEFRRLYPNKKITLIANQVWSSLAKLLPCWDAVIPVDRKKFIRNPIYRFKTLRRIRLHGIETAIQTSHSREFRLGDSLIRATGASHSIGSNGDLSNMTSWQKVFSDRWYSQLLPATGEPLMELQRNAEFMRGMGLRKFTASVPTLSKLMDLPANLTIVQPYFVIFPGASWLGRLWPVERFGELLSKLTRSNGGLAVLCGSREERVLCARVIDSSGMEALNLAGETSLPELVEVIRRAKFLVGNDTSAVHIAAAVGTPSVCILGGGHYGRFMPYVVDGADHTAPVPVIHRMDCFGCNWQCTQPHEKDKAMPCISHITVHEVLEAVVTVLATHTLRCCSGSHA